MVDDLEEELDEDVNVPSEGLDGNRSGVLDPEELDISESESVAEIEENRYVVSPDGSPTIGNRSNESKERRRDVDSGGESENPNDHNKRESGDVDSERREDAIRSPSEARSMLLSELQISNGKYGLDIVADFDGKSSQYRMLSDDVVTTFENMVRWYAQNVTDSTPTDEVIEILLRESVFTTGETPNLKTLLEKHNLTTDDSISDLVGAIESESKK